MGRYLLLLSLLGASFLVVSCGGGSEEAEGWANAPIVVIPDSLPRLDSVPKPATIEGYSWTTGERTITETNCKETECSEISWKWFTLTQAPNAALQDSVNAFNWYYITAIPGAREQDLDSIAASFFREARKELPAGETFRGWSEEDRVWPAAATAQTFTVGGWVYFFSGGAHGNYASHLENFNVATGKRLVLNDIVAQPFNLFMVGERIFRKQKGIDPTATLSEGGFSFKEDVFYLPETFGILPEGLLFVYAPYEIASYAEGEQYLLIPYSVIANELKPEYQYLAQ